MYNWYIFLCIITGIMMGITYAGNIDLNQLLERKNDRDSKKSYDLNREKFETAYIENTNFKAQKIHEIYAFHPVKQKEERRGRFLEKELIRVPVIKEVNTVYKMISKNILLDRKALKIRDLKVGLKEKETEILQGQVVFKGILNTDIFYAAVDKTVYHQNLELNFAEVLNLPDIIPGGEVLVEPSIEHTLFDLDGGKRVNLRLVVKYFVKLMVNQQIYVKTGEGPLLKTERVINENAIEKKIKKNIDLGKPVSRINNVNSLVKNIEVDILAGKAVIRGTIENEIEYIDSDEDSSHLSRNFLFYKITDIPEQGNNVKCNVKPEITSVTTEMSAGNRNITEEIDIKLQVSYVQSAQLHINPGSDLLAAFSEVIGHNEKQINKDILFKFGFPISEIKKVVPEVKEIKTTVLDDCVIIRGEIYEELYYLDFDNSEHFQENITSFSTFIKIDGVRPGMKSRVEERAIYSENKISKDENLMVQNLSFVLYTEVLEDVQFKISPLVNIN